jgi:protein gp37
MGETSAISWTDATQNFWIGCTKVGPGCDHCYAERDFDLRKGVAKWGAGNPRHRTKTWGNPRKWQRAHEAFFSEHGRPRRVFAQSLSDFFDNEIDPSWRAEAWDVVRDCGDLEWYIVTKRIGNVAKMLPPDWSDFNYRHIVLIITVVNQEEADREIPKLLALKAANPWLRVGLSIEPMLGPINLRPIRCRNFVCGTDEAASLYALDGTYQIPGSHWSQDFVKLDWVICGGESGPNARPMHPDWAHDLMKQCAATGVPFHFKQWGEWIDFEDAINLDGVEASTVKLWSGTFGDGVQMALVGKKRAGRLLDGIEHNQFPEPRT